MLKRMFSMGFALLVMTCGWAAATPEPVDDQMVELFAQIGEELPEVVKRADRLTELLRSENQGAISQHETLAEELNDHVNSMANEIPLALQDGRYVQVPLESVYVQQIVAILESLEFLSEDAVQSFSNHTDVQTLVRDPDYRRTILVLHDFVHDLDRLTA